MDTIIMYPVPLFNGSITSACAFNSSHTKHSRLTHLHGMKKTKDKDNCAPKGCRMLAKAQSVQKWEVFKNEKESVQHKIRLWNSDIKMAVAWFVQWKCSSFGSFAIWKIFRYKKWQLPQPSKLDANVPGWLRCHHPTQKGPPGPQPHLNRWQ